VWLAVHGVQWPGCFLQGLHRRGEHCTHRALHAARRPLHPSPSHHVAQSHRRARGAVRGRPGWQGDPRVMRTLECVGLPSIGCVRASVGQRAGCCWPVCLLVFVLSQAESSRGCDLCACPTRFIHHHPALCRAPLSCDGPDAFACSLAAVPFVGYVVGPHCTVPSDGVL
jgi:hypothetical protein